MDLSNVPGVRFYHHLRHQSRVSDCSARRRKSASRPATKAYPVRLAIRNLRLCQVAIGAGGSRVYFIATLEGLWPGKALGGD
jgi:hypothetical protein